MDSKILQLMESADPQDRKKAVKMLAQVGGPEAIRALGTIYKQDSDPEVKELAIQAGKYIKRQQAQANAAPVSPQPTYRAAPVVEEVEEEDEPAEEEEFQPVVVPASKQEQAKGLMDRALDLSMHGEKDKAIESLSKAFKLNPNLQLDTYYMGVAMDITGLDKRSTIGLITIDEKTRKAKNKEKAKNDGSGGGNDEVTWETALIDLLVYFSVTVGIAIVGIVLSNRIFQMTMTSSGYSSNAIAAAMGNVSLVTGILFSLIAGVITVGALMFHYAIMHFIATMFLGGEGTYRGLVHHATTPITIWTGITGAISLAGNYFTSSWVYNNPRQSMQAMTDYLASPAFVISSILVIVIAIVFLIWFCVKVGQNYAFGWGKGCVTVIGWIVSLTLLSCACYFTLFTVIINALGKATRTF